MKIEQMSIDLSAVKKVRPAITAYDKRKWRKAFTDYSERMSLTDMAISDGYCACGNMFFCDYCDGEKADFNCGMAIQQFCEKRGIEIDYKNYDFEKEIERISDKWEVQNG